MQLHLLFFEFRLYLGYKIILGVIIMHLLDFLSVGLILVVAISILVYNFKKIRKSEGGCASICNGCSGDRECSTKQFNMIPIRVINPKN